MNTNGEILDLLLGLLLDGYPLSKFRVAFQGGPFALKGVPDVVDQSYTVTAEIFLFEKCILDRGIHAVYDLTIETAICVRVMRSIWDNVILVAVVEYFILWIGDGRNYLLRFSDSVV